MGTRRERQRKQGHICHWRALQRRFIWNGIIQLTEELDKIKFSAIKSNFLLLSPLPLPAEVSAVSSVPAFMFFGGYGSFSFEHLSKKKTNIKTSRYDKWIWKMVHICCLLCV